MLDSLTVVRREVDIFSHSLRVDPLVIVLRVAGRFSYSFRAGLSRRRSARGGGDSLTRPVLDSVVIIQRVVGRFYYSLRAGLSRRSPRDRS